jgi:alginate O-acetyltransferase complex protein AlgI
MLFNSYAFIFLFIPITFAVYYWLNWRRLTIAGKAWLTLTSLFFYGYWNPVYVPLILASIFFNYGIGSVLLKKRNSPRSPRAALIAGVCGNLALLAYFKYMDFFIMNINAIASFNIKSLHIILPLGISFFTFTQIAYLVDTYRGIAKEYSLLNYGLFVTFFPHLLAGPIIHHKEMMPQFDRLKNKVINYKNIVEGLGLFFIGLFKKVVIADTLAFWANTGFDDSVSLTLMEAWTTIFAYGGQLYFDFSGYTDMALGSSLLFNIRLPINFNIPYRSLSVQEFWRRWHITLGRFVREYIYIPLGGNRKRESHVLFNILFSFFLIGLWHGAGWTFVLWGVFHGCGAAINRLWGKTSIRLPSFFSWLITFLYINVLWSFFRAKDMGDALKVLRGLFGISGVTLPESWLPVLSFLKLSGIKAGTVLATIHWDEKIVFLLIAALLCAVLFRNSDQIMSQLKPRWWGALFLAFLSLFGILNLQKASEFIYFNF